MQKHKVNSSKQYVLLMFYVFVILALSFINIKNTLSEKKVLGAETQEGVEVKFWDDFLDKNPHYIPGWIELNRPDQVKIINPNYQLPSNQGV